MRFFSWIFRKNQLKFNDFFISKDGRYSIGVEAYSGKCYLSIPVSNRLVDYEEYYEIDEHQFEEFKVNPGAALDFAEKCRSRQMDHLLIVKPGRDRGSPS